MCDVTLLSACSGEPQTTCGDSGMRHKTVRSSPLLNISLVSPERSVKHNRCLALRSGDTAPPPTMRELNGCGRISNA